MAIIYSGTKVIIDDKKVPDGILKPTITTFNGGTYDSHKWIFEIDKASVQSADPKATFDTLVTFLDTAIESKLINDFVGTNTVDSFGYLYDVQSNLDTDQDPNNSDAYKNIVPAYVCYVDEKVKIS